jgi:hypothetical protein
MTGSTSKQRRHQPYHNGQFGLPFQSPKKKKNYTKNKELKAPIGFRQRQQELLRKLGLTEDGSPSKPATAQNEDDWEDDDQHDSVPHNYDDPFSFDPTPQSDMDCDTKPLQDEPPSQCPHDETEPEPSPTKSTQASPSKSKESLHSRWKKLLPTLVPHYLAYCERTLGKPLSVPTELTPNCSQGCTQKVYQVDCLFFDRTFTFSIPIYED